MKLSSITIRGMHKVSHKTYDLKNFNYFVGSNGSGKSTVLQAIQLALLGYIPGTDKTKSGIFKHCNGNMMMVELTIDADDKTFIVNRTWTKKSKDIVATVTTVPEDLDVMALLGGVELPVFNFNEFIGMSANKIKDWFMNFLPAADDEIDWDKELNGAISEFGTILDPEFVAECIGFVRSCDSDGIQLVRDFNTYLKSQQSFKKGELNRVQSTIQSLIYYEDCDESEDSDALKLQNKQDEQLIDDFKRKLYLSEQRVRVQHDLDIMYKDLVADTVEEDSNYIEHKKSVSDLRDQESEISDKLRELQSECECLSMQFAELIPIVNGKGVCPYSNSECITIKSMYDTCNAQYQDVSKSISDVQSNIDNLKRQRYVIMDAISTHEVAIADLTSRYEKRDSLMKQICAYEVDIDVDFINNRISELSNYIDRRVQKIIQLEANKKYAELTDKLTAEKFAIEQCIDILKVWIKLTDVNGLQSRLMNAPFNNLFMSMQQDLYNIFKDCDFNNPTYNMSDKANGFSFGVQKGDKKYVEYDLLSSGEKCLYMFVLLIAIVRTSKAKLPIIMVDDFIDHLDGNRIVSCFETLYNVTDVQIILAGVAEPTHTDADDFVIRV